MSFFKKIIENITHTAESVTKTFKQGLQKTKEAFTDRMDDLFNRYSRINDDFYDELEEILISADIGVKSTMKLIDELRTETKKNRIENPNELKPIIIQKLLGLLHTSSTSLHIAEQGLTVILIVGVNGVGKTTSIGKLAYYLKLQGKKVLIAAGDTFRAGAIDQLEVWGKRTGVDVIKQHEGSDPAAVIYDALQAAKHRQVDILLCDTAGRLQNKVNLMEELHKIFRVIQREVPDAPQEVLLVLDATTGQNALSQAKLFAEKTNVTGMILTKLDGTAKGGIVIGINQELHIPVKFVGLGEQKEDFAPFEAEQFVHAIFGDWLQEDATNKATSEE